MLCYVRIISFTHQLKKKIIVQPQCYGVRRCVAHMQIAEVVFIQPGGKLDAM